MADTAISRLSSTAWCNALITSPDWTLTRTASRDPKPTTEDSFFAETLATSRTIRGCVTLRPTKELDPQDGMGDMAYGEVRTIVELGDGLNGHPRVAHGGFVATMLDEIMGVLLTLNIEAKGERRERAGLKEPREVMAGFTACELRV
jgi:thioesterase superfamily protein 4